MQNHQYHPTESVIFVTGQNAMRIHLVTDTTEKTYKSMRLQNHLNCDQIQNKSKST